MRRFRLLGVLLASAALYVAGCKSPFSKENADEVLRRRVAGAIDRELATIADDQTQIETTQPPATLDRELAGRRDELKAVGPQVPFQANKLDMGLDLTGREQQEVVISLQTAIEVSVRNNLAIQSARLQPAINEADVVAAEAAFDAVFIGSVEMSRTDEPVPVTAIFDPGTMTLIPLGNGINASDSYRFETQLRQRLTSGGEVFVSTNLSRFYNRNADLAFLPDPSYSAAVRLGITQPLLRGFGTSVNTASIRLARNFERRALQQLHSDLLFLLEDTEAAYWDLRLTWQALAIQEWLLEVGIGVRDVMDRRRDFDTKPAEYSDAVARVEERKANVISARRQIRAASDNLKVLLNDPQLTIGTEALLVPADRMVDAPIRYNLREAVMAAMANRPEIQQAILSIDDAAIRQMLADNNRLPLLNLSAEMGYFGLGEGGGDAYSNLLEGSFMSWLLGATFEWPIGNRAAEAGYRQARLVRSVAVIDYQRVVQIVVFDVKVALRDCITNYELIQANRSSRLAAAENLRALLVEEETLAGLTPEFLNLKFQRQDRLAIAQQNEIAALVNYNTSVAALYRALGIGLVMNRIDLEIDDVEDPDELAVSPLGPPQTDASTGQGH